MKTGLRGRKRKDRFERKVIAGMIQCNICGNPFRHHSLYDRFCNSCRNHSKVFAYSEWMPETGVAF